MNPIQQQHQLFMMFQAMHQQQQQFRTMQFMQEQQQQQEQQQYFRTMGYGEATVAQANGQFSETEALRQAQAQGRIRSAQGQAETQTPVSTQDIPQAAALIQDLAQASQAFDKLEKKKNEAELTLEQVNAQVATLAQNQHQAFYQTQFGQDQKQALMAQLQAAGIQTQDLIQAQAQVQAQAKLEKKNEAEPTLERAIAQAATLHQDLVQDQDLAKILAEPEDSDKECENEYKEVEKESDDNEEEESFDGEYDGEVIALRENLERVIADFHDYKKETSKEIRDLKDKIDQIPRGEVQKVNDELQKEHEIKDSEFEDQKSELKDSFEKVKELEEKLMALEKQLYNEQAEKNGKINELKEKDNVISALQAKLKNFESVVKEKDSTIEIMQQKIKFLLNELKEQDQEINEIKEKNGEKIKELEMERSNQAIQLAAKNDTIKRKEQEINNLRDSQMEKELQMIQKIRVKDLKIRELELDHSKQINRLKAANYVLKTDLLSKNDVIKRQEQQINSFVEEQKKKDTFITKRFYNFNQ